LTLKKDELDTIQAQLVVLKMIVWVVAASALIPGLMLLLVLSIALLRARLLLAPRTRARHSSAKVSNATTPLQVAFVHPDLGIGGAERLVVDAAVGLVGKGVKVVMYTSHHDPSHSFAETNDGTLDVRVYGDFLPRSILGRGHILCATLRGIYLSLAMLVGGGGWDVIIVDQLSVPVPILMVSGAKIIFYCHFPDQKLACAGGRLKALYRVPFDYLEETTTLLAHKILVNSKFTMKVFHETFRSAKASPEVLYPSINLEMYEPTVCSIEDAEALGGTPLGVALAHSTCFVSINRFERKKNISLALQAFAHLRAQLQEDQKEKKEANTTKKAEKCAFSDLRLIIAGGYDPRVDENVAYYQELEAEAEGLGIREQVLKISSKTAVKQSSCPLSRVEGGGGRTRHSRARVLVVALAFACVCPRLDASSVALH
jgi:alpha-1,3/alpha-1,6-mannosyltransferase